MRSLLNYEYNGQKRGGHGARLVKIRLFATVVAILDTIVYMTIIFVPGWVPWLGLFGLRLRLG